MATKRVARKKETLHKGYTCACGEWHKYPAYVYAHYDIELVHTCPSCRKQYFILRGVATPRGPLKHGYAPNLER